MKANNVRNYPDLWRYLQSVDRPVVLYGMGDGADKIIAVCEKYGIEISAVFASDGFVRGQIFHEMKVTSYADIKSHFSDPIILISFASSLPDVMAKVYEIANESETYIPDVPVVGNELFCAEFAKENEDNLRCAYELLADAKSKELFKRICEFKLYGLPELLCEEPASFAEILSANYDINKWKTALDLGAYKGDTLQDIVSVAPNLEKIMAVEPDAHSYRKLNETAEAVLSEKIGLEIMTKNCAAWSASAELEFKKGGSRSSRLGKNAKSVMVEACAFDNVLDEIGMVPDFIKFDVEGAELEAINGLRRTISGNTPEMCVPLYHKSKDMFELPLLISSINEGYRFTLSRQPGFPAWDLFLNCKNS